MTDEERKEAKVEEINIFDKETIIENCTVIIWENTETGQISVGWKRNT